MDSVRNCFNSMCCFAKKTPPPPPPYTPRANAEALPVENTQPRAHNTIVLKVPDILQPKYAGYLNGKFPDSISSEKDRFYKEKTIYS